MRYAGIIKNDFSAAPGTCVTFFTQGCPHKCEGCHNPETWDFDGGKEFTKQIEDELLKSINDNNIQRNLCIMGGEPLCAENVQLVDYIIKKVKQEYPTIKIYLWTGYTYERLQDLSYCDQYLKSILMRIDCLIDGPYIKEKRNITLKMRGSSNQRILWLKAGEIIGEES